MRLLLLGTALIAFAAPAEARNGHGSAGRDPVVDSLPSPAEVHRMTDAAGRAAEAILDAPVGGLVQAIDPGAPVRRDDTVATLSGEPDVHQRVRRSADRLGTQMEALLTQVAVAAPELSQSLREMKERFGKRPLIDIQLVRL